MVVLADWDGLLAGPWLSCPLDHQRNATRAPISRAFRILPSVSCRPYVSRRYAPAAKLNEGSPQSNDQSDYSFLYRNGACRSELGTINSVIGAISDALIRRIPKLAISSQPFPGSRRARFEANARWMMQRPWLSAASSGNSPRANRRARIATNLNRDGIPGPSGRTWGDTTIRGHACRRVIASS